MGRIESALKTFELNSNFTDNDLERAYKLRRKITPVDFTNKKVVDVVLEGIDYDYQILKIFSGLKEFTRGTNFLKDGTFNISDFNVFPDIDSFYKKETNRLSLSHLFSLLKLDFANIEMDIEKAAKKEELEVSFNNFVEAVKEDFTKFTNNVLGESFSKKELTFINSIILQDNLSIKNVVVGTYRFAVGEEKLVTTKFKEEIEKYPHDTNEYHKGLACYTKMITAKTYDEAVEIYNEAKKELLPEELLEETKPNVRK